MRSMGRRVGVLILSLLVSLMGCSDPDVTFPPMDAADEAAVDAGRDVSVGTDARDARVDADAGRADAPPDVSTDPDADRGLDAVDALADTVPPDDVPDITTIDVPGFDEGNMDVAGDPTVDANDESRDAVSEEAGTCGSYCASGVCDMNGDCTPCVKDAECTGGRICNAGTCGPRCGDGGVACTGNLVCCTDHCVDTTRDPQHCGACATTCSAAQFCGNASTPACKDNLLRNVCNVKKATFLLDGLPEDDAASGVLRNAIAALCVPLPMLTSVNQTMSAAINGTTGQPLAGGGELLVAAGGDSTQLLPKYLETSRTSSVYNESDGVTWLDWKLRGGAADGGDSVIRRVDLSTITPTHDFFLAEVVKDPITGTFSLIIYGIDSQGTQAGALYFANIMLPNMVGADVTTFTQAWYVYEWTSVNPPDAGPSLGDTFAQVAAGL
ncbi:MAG TPA: hypothetical protein VK540_16305 [Polyangiaceae bacterium]|nr:hypothetical protein [Polyangiaceae bacterium]